MVVICAVPDATSDVSRNNNSNHTLPGPRTLEPGFRYQAPDPSIFSDLLQVGSGGPSGSHNQPSLPTQRNENTSDDKEDTMGARNSKMTSSTNFKYDATNPDILQLPSERPGARIPDRGPEYVYLLVPALSKHPRAICRY